MAVRIDMDMPDSCIGCRFLFALGNKPTCAVMVIKKPIKGDLEKIQSWCPLKECE